MTYIPKKEDGEVLRDIYKKISIDGTLKEQLSMHEMVILFCVGNWLAEHNAEITELMERMEDDGK